jgi:plasmid stabilization system protein ParE
MVYQHRLHTLAHQDILDAYTWYEDQQVGLGDRFAIVIEKKIIAICTNPYLFGSKTRMNYREALVKTFPYIIVYKVYEQERMIFISSIHHAKKHPRKKFR